MKSALHHKLKVAWLRCSFNLLLEQFGLVVFLAGIAVVLAALAERLLGFTTVGAAGAYVLGGVTILAGLLLWLWKWPSRMQTALLIDERLALKERFSTALALAGSKDPFVAAAKSQAQELARTVKLSNHFKVRPTRRWLYAIGSWAVATAVLAFMPALDLLSRQANRLQSLQRQEQLAQARQDVKTAADRISAAVKELGDSEMAAELAALSHMNLGAKPEQIRRQAIRKLGDLSENIQKLQNDQRLAMLKPMQDMLKNLRSSPQAFSQELYLALARGQMGKAAEMIKQFQKQLAEGELSDRQRQDLAQQLGELGKQLEELAKQNAEFEKELQAAGLNKDLAKLSPEQLRKALQESGLTVEQIEQLLQKQSACQAASAACNRLGQGMAQAGMAGADGMLNSDELAELAGQLYSLEALGQDLALAQASLDEIGRAIGMLGEADCLGGGGQGPWQEGFSQSQGMGTGGPGIGFGPRGTTEGGDTDLQKTRAQSKQGKGPTIASWYFKGPQVKTEARRDFAEVIQTSRDGAAEAVSENQIPRKYEESIKKYFGQLEESAAE